MGKTKDKDENPLLDDRQLRDKCVGRYEVLEKVKKLVLLPGTEFATINQIAEYYSTYVGGDGSEDNIVTSDGIRKIYSRHKEELDSDGTYIKGYKDFLIGHDATLENLKGKSVVTYTSGMKIEIPNRGVRVFSRRAILRIGMLLRDSKVAKEIRTQLLNIEEKASPEIKVQDIQEEQRLMLNVGMAYASGDINAMLKATTEYNAFQNRHITKLEKDNKALAGEVLEWADRSKLNAGIRQLSAVTGIPFANLWNELYKNLQYKYSIHLRKRGDKPYIQWIKEEEWSKVLQTFCAMCEAYRQSPTDMFQQVTPKIKMS